MKTEKVDRDTRMIVLKYIRKYDEYRKWYKAERDRITSSRTPSMNGMPHGSGVSDPTLEAVAALERLDKSRKVEVIKAIDAARELIAIGIGSDAAQELLKRAVWLSCLNGREFNFDAFAGAIPCERTQFYAYKRAFLADIKNRLEI